MNMIDKLLLLSSTIGQGSSPLCQVIPTRILSGIITKESLKNIERWKNRLVQQWIKGFYGIVVSLLYFFFFFLRALSHFLSWAWKLLTIFTVFVKLACSNDYSSSSHSSFINSSWDERRFYGEAMNTRLQFLSYPSQTVGSSVQSEYFKEGVRNYIKLKKKKDLCLR